MFGVWALVMSWRIPIANPVFLWLHGRIWLTDVNLTNTAATEQRHSNRLSQLGTACMTGYHYYCDMLQTDFSCIIKFTFNNW